MGTLQKLRFNFWDPAEMIKSLIEEWNPIYCKTEKSYEKSLYLFLHDKLEDIQITKQFARGRIHADLVVGDKIIIELKNNLNTTSKYQRLIGQISEYKKWDGQILVVLAGETDPNLKKQLKNFIEKEDLSYGFDEKVIIIEK